MLFLAVVLFGTDDNKLVDKHTEEDGVDDCIEDIEANHENDLVALSWIDLDHQEGKCRVVPHRHVLVNEEIPFFSLCRPSSNHAGEGRCVDRAEIDRRHPQLLRLEHVPHDAGNCMCVDDEDEGVVQDLQDCFDLDR